MFDFIARYPKLFPDHVRSAAFREQFMRDIPDVVAASGRIRDVLYGNPDFIAFAHWNANIDNCWFYRDPQRSEEHTSELQSLMRISYAVFCLKKKQQKTNITFNT